MVYMQLCHLTVIVLKLKPTADNAVTDNYTSACEADPLLTVIVEHYLICGGCIL